MFDKMKQVYEMQKKAKELQRQLESLRVEKSASDGRVKAAVNGILRLQTLTIDPALLAPAQKDALERTLTQVINEALSEAQRQSTAHASEVMKGMGL
jgi:DNA-binding YbaB/EbfC family protein